MVFLVLAGQVNQLEAAILMLTLLVALGLGTYCMVNPNSIHASPCPLSALPLGYILKLIRQASKARVLCRLALSRIGFLSSWRFFKQ